MWALVLPALAGLSATLTAEVAADGTVHGILVVPPGTEVVDPLASLPAAPDDLNQLRTFPGAPDPGEMRFEEDEPGVWSFHTRLPRRFGAIGHTAHGTYGSGGFYPQPLMDGEVSETHWSVQITLPGNALGVVGTTVGTGTLTWEGRSDRVVLALPRNARQETLQSGPTQVVVIGKGHPRRALIRAVEQTLPEVRLGEARVVLVEAPLRRRLVRPSHGVALVSDRIFRLFPAFQSYHDHGFVKGVATAASPHPDELTRQLDGAVRAAQWQAMRKGTGATGITRAFSWLPQIDYLLSSRRIAFYSELFEEVHSGDAVQDDLVEMLSPHRPGASARVQLDDRFGAGTSEAVNAALHQGLTLSQALQYTGSDPLLAREWRVPIPEQDYVLEVAEAATITRVAAPGAPPETVFVRTDEGGVPLTLAPGETVTMQRPERIRIDPEKHVLQTSRARDSWPQRPIRVVATAFIDNLNLTRFRIGGSGALYVRGRYDTRNLFYGSAYSRRSSIVGASVGYTRKFGPLKDGISRQHRFSIRGGPRVIDPAFLSDEDGPVSVSGSIGYSWDTRVSSDFPLRGRRVSVSVGGGTFPGTDSRWGNAGISAVGVTSPHPRHAVAGRLSADIARSSRADQLITLGGLGSMRSLPVLRPCYKDADPCADVAREQLFGSLEYRVAPLRGMSVPLGLAWWTELQITAGLEATAATLLAGDAAALGATVGVGGIGDLAGAEPTYLGFIGGWLLWQEGLTYAEPLQPVPEIYLLFSQAF